MIKSFAMDNKLSQLVNEMATQCGCSDTEVIRKSLALFKISLQAQKVLLIDEFGAEQDVVLK